MPRHSPQRPSCQHLSLTSLHQPPCLSQQRRGRTRLRLTCVVAWFVLYVCLCTQGTRASLWDCGLTGQWLGAARCCCLAAYCTGTGLAPYVSDPVKLDAEAPALTLQLHGTSVVSSQQRDPGTSPLEVDACPSLHGPSFPQGLGQASVFLSDPSFPRCFLRSKRCLLGIMSPSVHGGSSP